MKKIFSRVKSQQGMSGVLVALLLVIVGVGLVAGVSTFMNTQKDAITESAEAQISAVIDDTNGTK